LRVFGRAMILRELSAVFDFKYNPEGFKRATSALDNLAQKANMVIGAIAGHYMVSALSNALENISQKLNHIGQASDRLGMSANSFQQLKYAAEKTGISLDSLEDCLKELMLRSVDARSGAGDAAEGFLALGIAVKDSSGKFRGVLDLLDEVADKVKAMPTESEQIWVLDKLFGDPGYVMLSMLKNGSLGLQELKKEATALGLSLEDTAIKSATNYHHHLQSFRASLQNFADTIFSALMPVFSKVMEKISNLMAIFNQLESKVAIVRLVMIGLSSILMVLGAKLAIAFAPSIIAMAPVIASVTAISALITGAILLVEDLWTAFWGGDSVTGAVFSKLKTWFDSFTKWVSTLWQKFQNIVPDFLKQGRFKLEQAFAMPQMSSPVNQNSIFNQQKSQSNQSVNVAVDVKSGANPREIGQEVSKAVKLELEKERENLLMGMSYAY